jgi:transposase
MTVEIITGIERRRRWGLEEKLRVVAEAERPDACFAEVARRHDVSRGLLWKWRQQVRCGTLSAAAPPFVPVHMLPAPIGAAASTPAKPALSRGPAIGTDAVIEIALADGTKVRVGRDVSATSLRRVLGVLRG